MQVSLGAPTSPRLWYFLALSTGAPSAEAVGPAPSSVPSSGLEHELRLFWSDHYELLQKKLPVWGRTSVQKHVEDLFREIGVRVRWLDQAPGDERTSGALAVRIVLMPVSGEGWHLPGNAMGAVMDRRLLTRTLYIFFPNVLYAVGDGTGTKKMLRNPRRIRVLARAFGRVVAHEVIHAIDPEIPHATADSVMSARLTPEMLRREVLGFTSGTANRTVAAMTRAR